MLASNPHAIAIIEALQEHGLTVGDGEGRKNDQGQVIAPQVILHMIPGGVLDGTAANPDEWADARFRVVAVGRLAAEARFMADEVDAALSFGLEVPGRFIQRVRAVEPWGATERDHDLTPPLFYCGRTYGLFTFHDPDSDIES